MFERAGALTVAAWMSLVGCGDDDENPHTQNATCVARRVQAQSTPGAPAEQWPKYIDVMALDICTGETYGPLVEDQLAANPDTRDDLEGRFVALRVLDILGLAEAPPECDALMACANGTTQYNTYGDCLTMTEQTAVADEAMNLLGCEGSLSDESTQVVCAEFFRSALLETFEACF